jgi:hypothetical protein
MGKILLKCDGTRFALSLVCKCLGIRCSCTNPDVFTFLGLNLNHGERLLLFRNIGERSTVRQMCADDQRTDGRHGMSS